MNETFEPIANIYALNTDLIRNCLDGVTAKEAEYRIRPSSNSIAFLLLHIVESRHFIIELLGRPLENPLAGFTGGAKSIDDIPDLPSLSDLVNAWESVRGHLEESFARLTPTDLSRQTTASFPLGQGTTLDALTFLAQHESYHIGQIGFLRRHAGLPAMKYMRR